MSWLQKKLLALPYTNLEKSFLKEQFLCKKKVPSKVGKFGKVEKNILNAMAARMATNGEFLTQKAIYMVALGIHYLHRDHAYNLEKFGIHLM